MATGTEEFIPLSVEELLCWFDVNSVPYIVRGERFLINRNKCSIPNVIEKSLRVHQRELLMTIWPFRGRVCALCKGFVRKEAVRLYVQGEGVWKSYHYGCFRKYGLCDASELLLARDNDGVSHWILDSGLCAYCNTNRAVYPESSPNLCISCYGERRKQNRQKIGGPGVF
jgi:hypothetical protein